jgi:hypothetical protein
MAGTDDGVGTGTSRPCLPVLVCTPSFVPTPHQCRAPLGLATFFVVVHTPTKSNQTVGRNYKTTSSRSGNPAAALCSSYMRLSSAMYLARYSSTRASSTWPPTLAGVGVGIARPLTTVILQAYGVCATNAQRMGWRGRGGGVRELVRGVGEV